MDIQTMVNGIMSQARAERLANSSQLLLGELKLKLETIKDKSKEIVFDFGMKPAGASSWRGSYCELGLEYSEEGGGGASWNGTEVEWESENKDYRLYKSETFDLPKKPTTQNFLDMLNALTDKEMFGYKGGDYKMHKNVAVYFGNCGQSDIKNYRGEEYATVAPFDVAEEENQVVILTNKVEY